ncbi:poly(beta-D-mannuronate) lyase [Mucilaginibacter lappiensis]|uniref:Poly(Beta-D-mannuronate) lyase n=1 Tax=Mucilaginibacter lappiensis TaxID=354630 RepID=A0ABR6PHK8_9SPHI|nr:polysaccharide lyase 6 family protein [Mucilaginibacter lappiensis]MBB6108734.1 poly(beta-D-mannuronate) lyase [Mucilaginibacter lappiensis]SIQ26109.1 poly(beta-D-mannuronate) lyase [Mucilaginibacter lappiensis]
MHKKYPYIYLKSKISRMAVAFVVLLLLASKTLLAQTITVSSVADLQKAIDKAKPGSMVLLADGVYTTTEDVVVRGKGTREKPITIAAQHTGAAEITGKGGFSLQSPAAYVIIRGFKFTHAASKAKMGVGTTHCRFTQNIFENQGDGEDLTIAGSDQEVDHNTFQNKNAMGRFIAIRGEGKQIAERLYIHHNYFNNFASQGGKNGAEALQFGLSGFSLSSSNSVVEYNLFERCEGENELISVKASAVILRYNTIRDCPAQFTLRHGNKSLVYGNYFFNTPGLRIFGDDHLIYSNYFENCSSAIMVGNGDGEVADGAQLTAHDRPDRVLIAFNTLVNNKENIIQTARKNGLGATYITVADNLIQGGGPAATISGPYTNPQWTGNIVFQVKDAGNMPAEGYITVDPKLARNTSGTYHLQAGSPAIDHGTTAYPALGTDMDGQPRTAPFDIGADEQSNAPIKAHALSAAEVGYQAKN